MAGWLSGLLGKNKGKKSARAASSAKSKTANDDPRAQLIKDALALHRDQGALLRATLQKNLKALEDRRTLRNPEELERLLALAQAQRAMQRLFSGDLRRYLVLAGVRQWTGKEPTRPREAPDKSAARPRPTVTRR